MPAQTFRSRVLPTVADSAGSVDRGTLRLLTVLLVCEVFLQRLAIPVGETPIRVVLPIFLVGFGILLYRGQLLANITRTGAYLLAMAACSTAAFVALVTGQRDLSLTSLLLLIVIYLPFCFGFAPAHRASLFPRVLDRFVAITSILAALAVLQFGLQLVGWQYDDVLARLLPPEFFIEGYSTSYPVQYGSELYKSNGFVALEPSFTSQFLALGLVASVLRRARWWQPLLFALAILTTVSGTGLLLLAVALVLLSLQRGVRFAVTALAGVALVVTLIAVSPAREVFADRAVETSVSDSSGNLRFVQPYLRTYTQVSSEPAVALAGNGPGWADSDAERFFAQTGDPLQPGLITKLVGEYGLIATVLFLWFLATSFIRGSPSVAWSGAVIVFYAVLSSNLLNPVVAFLGLLLLTWFTDDRHPLAGWTAPTPRRSAASTTAGTSGPR